MQACYLSIQSNAVSADVCKEGRGTCLLRLLATVSGKKHTENSVLEFCSAWLSTVCTVWQMKGHIIKSDDECNIFIFISSS